MSLDMSVLPPPPPPPKRPMPPPFPPMRRPLPPGRPAYNSFAVSSLRLPPPPPFDPKTSTATILPIRVRPLPPTPVSDSDTETPSAPLLIPIHKRPLPPPPKPVSATDASSAKPLIPIHKRPLPPLPPSKESQTPSAPPPADTPPEADDFDDFVIVRKPIEPQEAASIIQRKYRAVKANAVFKKFRALLSGLRMKSVDQSDRHRSAPLVVRSFSSQADKMAFLQDFDGWHSSGKTIVLKTDAEFELIKDCTDLRRDIEEQVIEEIPGKVIAVYDTTGLLQAAAFVGEDDDMFVIDYLVTAPWNQDIAFFKGDARRVRGAGTAVIEEAIVQSMKAGYEGIVHLDAIGTAVPFYDKVEFHKEEREPKKSPSLKPMVLTEPAQFFRKYGGRALPA